MLKNSTKKNLKRNHAYLFQIKCLCVIKSLKQKKKKREKENIFNMLNLLKIQIK